MKKPLKFSANTNLETEPNAKTILNSLKVSSEVNSQIFLKYIYFLRSLSILRRHLRRQDSSIFQENFFKVLFLYFHLNSSALFVIFWNSHLCTKCFAVFSVSVPFYRIWGASLWTRKEKVFLTNLKNKNEFNNLIIFRQKISKSHF